MKANQPVSVFCAICDDKTGLVLFAGYVFDPAA